MISICCTPKNPSQALSRLDEDEKAEVTLSNVSSNNVTQQRLVSIVSESGMYSLVMTSRKPEANVSQKWVNTRTTLPAPIL